MPTLSILRRGCAVLLLAGVVAAGFVLGTPASAAPLHARTNARISDVASFRTALEPYGAWHHNRRFGDVWVPANRPRDWRPYTVGHWVYTDDYGWYWIVDDQEADWGWIAYHYGHWYYDPDEGWVWIPGDVWGPAWVDWRYSDEYVGWAPEPPDEFVAETEYDPTYWNFVATADLVAPVIATVLLPLQRRDEVFRRTELVNRPVMVRRGGQQFAVNPGVAPGNIAAVRGRPITAYNVRPRVLAGTAGVPGASRISMADLRRQRELGNRPGGRQLIATRATPSSTVIRPTRSAEQPLGRGEAGRLSQNVPRAARGAAVVQGAARNVPGAPSAQRQPATREQRQGNITPPNAPPPRTAGQAPVGPRGVERRAGGRERIIGGPPAATEQRSRERAPIARAPSNRPGIVQREPAARPSISRPPAIANRPQMNRPPAFAARPPMNRPPQARPSFSQPPAFARPSRPAAPPSFAARPAAPPAMARPAAPPAMARPAAPPAMARPSAPPAMARPSAPATMGAAPRGGPGQRRQ